MQLPEGGGAAKLVQLLAEEAAAADVGARLEATQRHGRVHGGGYSTHNGNRVTGQKVAPIMSPRSFPCSHANALLREVPNVTELYSIVTFV